MFKLALLPGGRGRAQSGESLKNESQGLVRNGTEGTAGIGHGSEAAPTQAAQDAIIKNGDGVSSGAKGHHPSDLMKSDSAGVEAFMFNGPRVTRQGEQGFGRGKVGRESGVPGHDFLASCVGVWLTFITH